MLKVPIILTSAHNWNKRAIKIGSCRQNGMFEVRILRGDGTAPDDNNLVVLGNRNGRRQTSLKTTRRRD